jgi:hypothetical protein
MSARHLAICRNGEPPDKAAVCLQVVCEALQQAGDVAAFLAEAAAALAQLLPAQVRAGGAERGACRLECMPPTPSKSVEMR